MLGRLIGTELRRYWFGQGFLGAPQDAGFFIMFDNAWKFPDLSCRASSRRRTGFVLRIGEKFDAYHRIDPFVCSAESNDL